MTTYRRRCGVATRCRYGVWLADFVITRQVKGNDDALVLVARYAR